MTIKPIKQCQCPSGIPAAWMVAGLAGILCLAGCGDFWATKPTELESKVVLDDLSQVRESPYISNPLPDIYRQPPSRVNISGGTKLFYFTRNLPVDQLADMVVQQFAYKVARNASTNQLVVYCADEAQADMAQQYLELVDVAPIQVNVDCLILERFGDVTMDWETSLFAENLFGENITLGESRAVLDRNGNLVALKPAFPGASLREPDRGNFGLDVGYYLNRDKPGHQVRFLVDMLVSRGYLKILLNPQIETVNGQKATVSIRDFSPIDKLETGKGGASDAYNITTYQWVEDTLTVTPHVFADGYVGLTTNIKIGSRSKPEGVVQRSIITERTITVEENRVKPGYSLIIGGMRKSEKRDVVRGVPFFKDLPVVGILFSSRDFEEKATEIIFILTPSISGGSRDHKQTINEIRTRYADPDVKQGLRETILDPLGSSAYTNIVEKEAVNAEMERVNAELQREQAANKAAVEKQLADEVAKEAARLKLEAQKLQEQADKETAEAQQAADAAAAALAAQTTESTKAAQVEAQKQKSLDEARLAKQAAQQAQTQAAEAAQKAAQQEERAQKAMEEVVKTREMARIAAEKAAEKARQAEAERQARLEAERKAKEEAELKARLEAEEKARLEAEARAKQEAQDKAAQEAEQKARQEAAAQPQQNQPAPAPADTPAPAPTSQPVPVPAETQTPQPQPQPAPPPAQPAETPKDPNTPAA